MANKHETNSVNTPEGGETPDHPFKGFKDAGGRFRTQSLFAEYQRDGYPAHFTLKREGLVGFINLYEKYMDIGDPTEYQVAIQLFGSWQHWNALKRSEWFMKHLRAWRYELIVKMESLRYYEMVENTTNPKTAVSATKWLATRYGEPTNSTRKAGRPTKEEKETYLAQEARDSQELTEDAQRIGIIPKG